MPTHVETLI